MLVTLLVLVALIFVLMGLLAEMQTRIYFESQGKTPYVIRETRNFDALGELSKESQKPETSYGR
jgi:hypothetical protein